MRQFSSEAEFRAYAERKAAELNARYGIKASWSDKKLDRALQDHGLPPLMSLPDTPQGMMRAQATDTAPSRAWRRMNAAHLLGHAILHDGERCGACEEWGEH